MITAIVRFKLPATIDAAKAAELFQGSAPKYQGLAGLIRKYYLFDAESRTGGGCYLWESREAAERVYIADHSVVEYKGARTGMITTRGYRDIRTGLLASCQCCGPRVQRADGSWSVSWLAKTTPAGLTGIPATRKLSAVHVLQV